MPVQFTNLRAKVFSVLGFPAGFTPNEVVIGAADGDLAQVSGLGSAGEVLTSQGPGSPPDWQPGGGGGGSGTRMPWDVLGGWLGSTCDIGLAISAITGNPFAQGTFLYADAIVCGEAGSFDTVAMAGSNAQTGTGAQVVVTDTAGNWLAHATNADAAFQGIGSTLDWVYLTMNTTVTVTAGQIVYVMRLFPLSTVSVPPTLWAGPQLPNWAPANPAAQSTVLYPSEASSVSGSLATIPNPQPITGLTEALNTPVWAGLVAL